MSIILGNMAKSCQRSLCQAQCYSFLSIIDWTTMFEEVSDTRTTFGAYRTHKHRIPFM